MVSGRGSFEILQECLAAGVPIVCAVSAPSSLAAGIAREFHVTLIGFLRGERFNVYAGIERRHERSEVDLSLLTPADGDSRHRWGCYQSTLFGSPIYRDRM